MEGPVETAFRRGKEARLAGKSENDNPHTPRPWVLKRFGGKPHPIAELCRKAWLEGFKEGNASSST